MMGLVVRVLVHPANEHDTVGLSRLVRRIPLYPRWVRLLGDQGYNSPAVAHWCQEVLSVAVEVTPPPDTADAKGFVPQPGRWVVERTFAWLGKYRRLSKDYEALPVVSEAYIYAASVNILVRRLARE
jgi:putative transposase